MTAQSTATKPKTVLLVEDDTLFRRTLLSGLQRLGFSVREAENGLVAKTIFDLNRKAFDLVISDVNMPEVDGISLLKHVRSSSATTKFIVITGLADFVNGKHVNALGADGFLTKPFHLQKLKRAIDSCFESKEEGGKEEPPIQYCKVPVEEFVTTSQLVVDLYVHLSGSKYIKIAHAGDLISVERLHTYKQKKLHYFYIRPDDLKKLVGFNMKVDKAASTSSKVSKETRLKLMANTANIVSQSLFLSTIDKESLGDASRVLENTINVATENESLFSLLGFLESSGDELYAHSVAVSVFACLIARQLGMSTQSIQMRVALGGLLHDIGKKELPPDVIAKTRLQMNAEEYKLFEPHCQRGKDILSQVPGLPEDVIQIAAHHHENNVSTGFPYGLEANRIHPLAKIVAVVDCFIHHMMKMRVADADGIHAALKKMNHLHEMEYDQNIVKALAKVVGGLSVGTLSAELPTVAAASGVR